MKYINEAKTDGQSDSNNTPAIYLVFGTMMPEHVQ